MTAGGPLSEPRFCVTLLCLVKYLSALPAGAGARDLAAVGDPIGTDDSAALATFKRALTLTPEVNQSWVGDVCATNASTWIGITCVAGQVTRIDLSDAHVKGGTLPAELAGLRSLSVLNMSKCGLTGSLPPTLSAVISLRHINLSNNRLQGTLPASWGGLQNLAYFDVGWNQLTGPLPPTFSNLSTIAYLYLNDNGFSGTLPATWADIGMNAGDVTVDVTLSQNRLTGPLPPDWSRWRNLGKLYITYNTLTGPLPSAWQALSQLNLLSLFGNAISGTLPAEWANLTKLEYLDISNNSLHGTLPGVWASIGSLTTMYLYRNTLKGSLPTSWSGLSSIQELMLMSNNLTGTLPAEWGQLTTLVKLSLASNNFTGPLPGGDWADNMAKLQGLYLQRNRISGTLPQEWFNSSTAWQSIRLMDLRWNQLWGPVPPPAQDASFRTDRQHSPRIYLEPMSAGPGMCGPVPLAGPTVRSSREPEILSNMPDGPMVVSFDNPCNGGVFFGWAKVVGLIVGAVGALMAVIVVGAVLLYIKKTRQKAGIVLPSDFFTGSMRSMVSWRRTPTSILGPDSTQSFSSRMGLLDGRPSPFRQNGGASPDLRSPRLTSPDKFGTPTGPTPFGLPETPGPDFKGLMPRRTSSNNSGRASELSRRSHSSLRSNQSLSVEDLDFREVEGGRRELIGSGAYGKVYRATWKGTEVAVKVLKEETHLELSIGDAGNTEMKVRAWEAQREELRREADLLEQLRHPNVVNFLGMVMEGDTIMVVTELCEGGDLYKAMHRARHSKAFSWYMRGSKIALDIACGLAYLHSMGVIHYDIKPGNILLDSSGENAKISDVGMSKSLATLSGTASNTVRGTLDYMAPELLLGERSSFAVDIYSFGVMLGEIITGESPDRRRGAARDPRVPEDCCEGTAALYLRCVDPNPECRPTSKELAEELRRLQPDMGLKHPEAIL